MSIVQQQQSLSKNYFVSIDFILHTVLFLTAMAIVILQYVLTLCKPQHRSTDMLIDESCTPSFGTNSWSATGLYVTCWAIIVRYIHTILLVFMDNFQIQFYATTFVIQDIIPSIFFLAWTTMNIIRLFKTTVSIYNVSSDTWSAVAQMLSARGYTATLLLSGKVLVIGSINNCDYLSSCELYDPSSNKWSAVASMLLPRVYHTASLLSSEKVLVTGGSSLPLGEIYDPHPIRGVQSSICQ